MLDIKGKLSKTENIDVYDLCTIFSNAISNAIEACEKMSDVKKIITISVLEQGKTIFFRFENPATAEMYETVRQNGTTKMDNKDHGFGILNIKRAVEKNCGEMEYLFQDGKLILEVYFEI